MPSERKTIAKGAGPTGAHEATGSPGFNIRVIPHHEVEQLELTTRGYGLPRERRTGCRVESRRSCEWSCMRNPTPTASLVPTYDVTVYIILEDFGKFGRAYRETDEEKADLETVIANLLSGEYRKPMRVVAFNTAEGWSRDVSEDIAWKMLNRIAKEGKRLPSGARDFAEFHVGEKETALEENSMI
jgi:hypothetical protein